MDPQLILGFAAISVALALTPGADWAYAISSGLSGRRIAPAVGGLLSGFVVHTLLIVAGLAALVIAMPQLLATLTLIGAAYLIWLGITTTRSWRDAGYTSAVEGAQPPPGNGSSFLRGLGTSGTNPKALLLYLALIP